MTHELIDLLKQYPIIVWTFMGLIGALTSLISAFAAILLHKAGVQKAETDKVVAAIGEGKSTGEIAGTVKLTTADIQVIQATEAAKK